MFVCVCANRSLNQHLPREQSNFGNLTYNFGNVGENKFGNILAGNHAVSFAGINSQILGGLVMFVLVIFDHVMQDKISDFLIPESGQNNTQFGVCPLYGLLFFIVNNREDEHRPLLYAFIFARQQNRSKHAESQFFCADLQRVMMFQRTLGQRQHFRQHRFCAKRPQTRTRQKKTFFGSEQIYSPSAGICAESDLTGRKDGDGFIRGVHERDGF